MGRNFHILDVFTDKALTGNQLAVVEDADDLTAEQMQAITIEFGFAETVFLQSSQNPVAASKMRIFTPAREIPFAGHPTIGTAILLAELKNKLNDNGSSVLMMLEEKIGLIRTAVSLGDGSASYAEFDSPQLPTVANYLPEVDLIADALGLSVADVGFENHKAMCVNVGPLFVYVCVPVRSPGVVRDAAPEYPFWDKAFNAYDAFGVYVYAREDGGRGGFHARMFAPDLGVLEDAATGSAAVAFAKVIEQFEPLANKHYETHISQGREMGRPSSIKLEIEFEQEALRLVRIGGHAVRVAEGTLL